MRLGIRLGESRLEVADDPGIPPPLFRGFSLQLKDALLGVKQHLADGCALFYLESSFDLIQLL
jgi:hypothetical protein